MYRFEQMNTTLLGTFHMQFLRAIRVILLNMKHNNLLIRY